MCLKYELIQLVIRGNHKMILLFLKFQSNLLGASPYYFTPTQSDFCSWAGIRASYLYICNKDSRWGVGGQREGREIERKIRRPHLFCSRARLVLSDNERCAQSWRTWSSSSPLSLSTFPSHLPLLNVSVRTSNGFTPTQLDFCNWQNFGFISVCTSIKIELC